ncbi:MAG: MBL fold metallo-hydrolase [Spirochaetes bacterium]|nr:MBL fold metallo-hydrolase [Spirochaetota bacterium]
MKSRVERLMVGPIGENVYAVESGGIGILIDPGAEPEGILRFLKMKEISISLIILTHGHLDHTAAIPVLLDTWKASLPKLAIHPLDAGYLGAGAEKTNKALFEAINALGFFHGFWKPLPEPDILLSEGDWIPGTSMKVIHTPGHSAGSICLYDAGSAFLISGDTLFRDGVGRSDGPDSDPRALELSLSRLAALPPETQVFPGHGSRTTIGREFPVGATLPSV